MGPFFKIVVRIQNAGVHVLYDVHMMCATNPNLYRVPRPCYYLPILVPQQVYIVEIPITCLDENGGTDCVRLFLCNQGEGANHPIISAIVNMPISEQLAIEGQD